MTTTKGMNRGRPGSEKKVGDRLTQNQRRIMDCIRAAPSISAREIAAHIGVSGRKAEQNIANLRSKDVLCRVGPAKGGHWEVVE